MKWKDEIVDQVREVREAYAAQFDYDLKRIFEDLKNKEQEDPTALAKLKPLKPHEQRAGVSRTVAWGRGCAVFP